MARRKRKKKAPLLFIGGAFLIVVAVVVSLVFLREEPRKGRVPARSIDGLIRGALLPMGLKEKKGEAMAFVLPRGLDPEEVRKGMERALKRAGYRATVIAEAWNGYTALRVLEGDRLVRRIILYPPKAYRARVAIVIDDLGHNPRIAEEVIELPVTLSILPYRPYSRWIAEEARKRGREVLLHLPMEARDPGEDPGKGALFTNMSEEEVREMVRRDLEALPYLTGVNNHMGSRFSADQRLMKVVLGELKGRGLLYLDSKTTPDSKGYLLARKMGIRALERDVFIDNKRDVDYIKGQLRRLMEKAKRKGVAIAIGHPRPSTVKAIREMLPVFEEEGIELVPLSSIRSP